MKSRSSRALTLGFLLTGVVAASAPACVTSSNNGPGAGADAGSFPQVDGAPGGGTDAPAATSDAPSSSSDAPSGTCPSGWVPGASGVCVVSMLGAWSPSTDANNNAPDTVATLGTVTATSVSVVQSHTGTDGADCGCNGQHLNIPLGKAFPCATSTLEFTYATTTVQSTDNSPGVDIRFCTGPCPSVDGGAGGPTFYGGPQFVGGPFAPGLSSCAYEWENDAGTGSTNYFPASALIQSGTNTIPLGTYAAPTSQDDCTGTFDTIDVHLQVYNCFSAQTGTSTLSNLRVY